MFLLLLLHLIFSLNCTSQNGAVSGPLLSGQDWRDDTYEGCRFLCAGGNVFSLCHPNGFFGGGGVVGSYECVCGLISEAHLIDFPLCRPFVSHVGGCAQCGITRAARSECVSAVRLMNAPRLPSAAQSASLCFITAPSFYFVKWFHARINCRTLRRWKRKKSEPRTSVKAE